MQTVKSTIGTYARGKELKKHTVLGKTQIRDERRESVKIDSNTSLEHDSLQVFPLRLHSEQNNT